jgi:hypothetical protein
MPNHQSSHAPTALPGPRFPAAKPVDFTFFPKHLPARSAFGASGLARNGRVEVECWATVERAARSDGLPRR